MPHHSENAPSLSEIFSIADAQLEGREISPHLRRLLPLSHEKEKGLRGPLNMAAQDMWIGAKDALNALGVNLDGENPFSILGLSTSVTADEARKRFRAAVKIVHPDRCVGFEKTPCFQGRTSEDAFDIVNQAYVELEKFRSSGKFFTDPQASSAQNADNRPWFKKLFGGTGLVRKEALRASDDDWDALALVVNALNSVVDGNLSRRVHESKKHVDSMERAAIESELLHEALTLQIPKISLGARKAAIEAFEGTTASDEHQRRRATSMLAKCLDRGWSVE